MHKGLLTRYEAYLPLTDKTPRLSLNEGNTPLIYAERLSEQLKMHVYLKYEGANPTGSFKDRGMVLAVAKAKEAGSEAVICASTGNTSASAAAYAARAGMRAIVVIPHGYVALGKLAQATMYGAEIIAVDGNFDQALHVVRDIADSEPITLVNSVNPFRLEGQKTGAFEICEQLERAPDYLAIPVGNAGNISAYFKGFREFSSVHQTAIPQLLGFQAAGAAPLVHGHPIEHPQTIATAIRIGNPASWELAQTAINESLGAIDAVSDEEILSAYQLLARLEGVFAEPASCASVAGLMKRAKAGQLAGGKTVVCILTGNGLKDPDTALRAQTVEPNVVSAERDAVWRAIVGGLQ
ncbi:threonine synthase [Sulfoacidibacillus thermotolerans]|uniref:Threonine synthase n=1 Tax=Sulfoacidibacillus thermotolerans TaxID=1765684 RepID=A0A2U3DAW3_SULT2|nr:threonine synthase [Sulfoacidibacillus thermotolerans]PWI58420.1 threonine synthase [Sulfoacidibacillus thermotolerans]